MIVQICKEWYNDNIWFCTYNMLKTYMYREAIGSAKARKIMDFAGMCTRALQYKKEVSHGGF
ncbi:MAG: hypothetical protein HFG52_10220 [Lachnospiraceae bacterium]|nr:hypothetical protein [Lachnospiraceae bacterium]